MLEAKRAAIVEALRETKGSMDGAAYVLDIARSTLYRKVREYEIEPRDWMERAA
jgi:transcriptional regulator of acetoin/glycerol metabolism